MAKRPHPRGTTTNPNDGTWQTCQRCGFVYSQSRISFQFDYMGGPTPMNTGLMVCSRCLDVPNEQFRLLILPPDPAPIFNTNPEPYAVDETDWLTTQGGAIIDTQDGEQFITQIPNPANTPVVGADTAVEEAAENITTEDGLEIVTEEGEGNPLDIQPNPLP